MKHFKLFFCVALFCLGLSGLAFAQDRVTDYFYPEGSTSYYIYNNNNNSEPVEKVPVHFEKNGAEFILTEDTPLPLVGYINYKRPMTTTSYNLQITDYAVTAGTWKVTLPGNDNSSGETLYSNLAMLKLPAEGETLTWTTTVNQNGQIKKIWEMSAKRMMIPVFENGDRIAVKALVITRNVFDSNHNLLPKESATEFWRLGKGKIKEVRMK